ncbi:MAG: family 43 glycosylhydrolase, partial [Verrucomicrobiota bacterium]
RFDSVAASIDAHDGVIGYFNGTYYLYGTSYDCGFQWLKGGSPFCGFKAYSSTDLVNWTDLGFLFNAQTPVWQSRCNGSTSGCFRPHVIYNQKNNVYVLWINVNDNVSGYRVFVSASPAGPFSEIAEPQLALNKNTGGSNGDEDVFVDDDGTAYIAYTYWGAGGSIEVEALKDDYTSGTGTYVTVTTGSTEAPALMKRNGIYYLVYSDPNCGYCGGTGTSYRTATSPLGVWSSGISISANSCGGQPSFVSTINLGSQTVYLYCSDLWNNGAANEGLANFYWAPLTFATNGAINPITCQDQVNVTIQANGNPPAPPADLDNSSGSDGFTSFHDIGGNTRRSQSFVATRSGILSAVSFCTFQIGSPNAGLTLEIYQGTSNGLPTGTALSSILLLPEWIGWSPKLVTVSPEIAVSAGATYVMVAGSTASVGNYGMEYSDSDPLPTGKEAYSDSGGNSFSIEQNRSIMFRTYIHSLTIGATNQTGSGNGIFYPSWTVQTNGSLTASELPSVASGNFSLEAAGRSVAVLTASNDLGIQLVNGFNGTTCSTNYVTCGNGGGAGSTLIYMLPNNFFGFDLTNITVYGGWAGNGRDQQAYTLYYSTVDAPTNFILIGSVSYNPPVSASVQSATLVSIVGSNGVLATDAGAVKFDFTNPASENGYCGYGAIGVFGTPSINLPMITTDTLPVTAEDVVGSSVTFRAAVSGKLLSYQWQKIVGEITNNITGATNSALTLSHLELGDRASYQLVATNVYGFVVSTPGSLTVHPAPAPANNVVIAMAGQTGSTFGTFEPTWPPDAGGLISGSRPSAAAGNFSLEAPGRSATALTTANDLGITLINGPAGITSSTNYVTCGNGGGAGSWLIYSLTNSALGYNLTNITVYGGWASNGRDQQAYTVWYSTISAPSNFVELATVNYNPTNVLAAQQSATRVTLTAASGNLATNVAAVKIDFTTPPSENGYCGYAEINVFGTEILPPAVRTSLSAQFSAESNLVMNVGSMVVGRNYQLQSTTNLAAGVWSIETNIVATQSAATFTNATANGAQKFYRIVGY